MDIVKVLIDAARTAVGVPAAAYALAALGLNLQFGQTGLLNFGHVGFMMVGAYGTAITVDRGGPLLLGFGVGFAAAVLLGLLFGLPTLRLRADYLAIVTIAAAEALRIVVRGGSRGSLTRGVFGIQQFADGFFDLNPYTETGSYGAGRFSFSGRQLWVMTVGWLLVVIVALVLHRMVHSPWGRLLKAVREDEDAARSLGKNTFVCKLQSLCIGGAIGAGAGMLLAVDTQSVNPDTYVTALPFCAYTVLILGGTGSSVGPIAGSLVFWFVIQFSDGFLREAIDTGWIPGWLLGSEEVPAVRFIIVGLALMALMIFRPQGMFGKREEVLLDAR